MTSEQEKADRLFAVGAAVAMALKGSPVEINESGVAEGQHEMIVNHNGMTHMLELKFDWDNDKLLLVTRNEDLGPIDDSPAKIVAKINEPPHSNGSVRVF